MSQQVWKEISDNLCGKWELDRSQQFDEFLSELGLNLVFRGLARAAKPVIEIRVEDQCVKLESKVSFFNQTITFKLDEDYKQSFEGLEMNCRSKWEGGKLITEAIPVGDGKGKPQTFHREKNADGELVQTMWVGDVKCVRVFKKID